MSFNRLLRFFEQRGHLLGGQYGFRRGHSTDMAIIDMVEKIRKAWDMGEHCMGIFVDLSKVFDTVDHKGYTPGTYKELLQKPEAICGF